MCMRMLFLLTGGMYEKLLYKNGSGALGLGGDPGHQLLVRNDLLCTISGE